jgi:hypothetical protein
MADQSESINATMAETKVTADAPRQHDDGSGRGWGVISISRQAQAAGILLRASRTVIPAARKMIALIWVRKRVSFAIN